MRITIKTFILVLCLSLVFVQVKPAFAASTVKPGESTDFTFSATCGGSVALLKDAEVVLIHKNTPPIYSYFDYFDSYPQGVLTDNDGKASLGFKFPDNLSTGSWGFIVRYKNDPKFSMSDEKYQEAFVGEREWWHQFSRSEWFTIKNTDFKFHINSCPGSGVTSGGVSLEDVYTTDAKGVEKTIFDPNEPIRLYMHWKNTTGSPVTLNRNYKVLDESGAAVEMVRTTAGGIVTEINANGERKEEDAYGMGEITLVKGKPGTYTFRGALTFGEKTETKEAPFTVSKAGTQGQRPAAPKIVDPKNGQTLVLEGEHVFKIEPPVGALKYRLQESQNDKVIFDNDNIRLGGGQEYLTDALAYKNFTEGPVTVSISVYNEAGWSDASVITIILKSNKIGTGIVEDQIKQAVCEGAKNTSIETCNGAVNACLFINETKCEKAAKDCWNDAVCKTKIGPCFDAKNVSLDAMIACLTKANPTGTGGTVNAKMIPAIHGWAEGDLTVAGQGSLNWISVGASVVDPVTGGCIDALNNGAVQLILTKTAADGKTINIPVNKTPVLEGNKPGDPHTFNRICWSYQAVLPNGVTRSGTYKLDATYAGNSKYNPISDSVTAAFTDTKLTVTKTKIKVQGAQGVQGVSKIALSKLLKATKSTENVAGAQAKIVGGQVSIVDDPARESGNLTLVPESSVGNGNCDAQNLPVVHLLVTKILKDGSVNSLYENTSFPNCESWTLPLAELGDLNNVSSLRAIASLPEDPNSYYAPSQGDLVVTVSDNAASAQPFMQLSSNPSPESITSFDSQVSVAATTNRDIANPVFEVNHNGQKSNMAAAPKTGNCSDGISYCQYVLNNALDINNPEGDYEIIFAGNTERPLKFSIANKPAGTISSVGFLIGGEEVSSIHLDGSPKSTILVVVHYADGSSERKNITFEYDQSAASPAPSDDSNCVYSDGGNCYKGHTNNQSTCTWINGICVNPEGCQYRSGPVDCPQGAIASPTPAPTNSGGGCGESKLKYNQCVACNTFQPVFQDGCGNYTTGNNQYDPNECKEQCVKPTPTPAPSCTEVRQYNECISCNTSRRVSQDSCGNYNIIVASQSDNDCASWCSSGDDAGAQGKDCIYSDSGACYSGTVRAQSSCGSKTTSGVCINPSGGCQWGDGSHQVDCQTGI